MKPRLLFISNLFPDTSEPYRGLDNVTVLHQLREQWDIRVIALRPSLKSWIGAKANLKPRDCDACFAPEYLAVPYVPKLGSRFNHRLMHRALKHVIAPHEPDVIMAAWIYPDGWAVTEAAAQVPTVLIAQGSDVHQYLHNKLRRNAILEAAAHARATITRSRSLTTLLAEAGAEPSKLHPIHNGVDTSVFHPGDQHHARSMLGITHDDPIVLFVGNLLDVKNPHLLLRAFAQVPSSTHLALAGKGPLRDELEQLATELGIHPRVKFLGPQTAAQIGDWMRAADLLCMSSRNEGLPNVVLEAQACGLPVVATNVGGIHEVIDAPHKGTLATPGDVTALAEALKQRLQQRQRVPVEGDRSWAAAAAAYHAVLESARQSKS